jgi:hypothetical protein
MLYYPENGERRPLSDVMDCGLVFGRKRGQRAGNCPAAGFGGVAAGSSTATSFGVTVHVFIFGVKA